MTESKKPPTNPLYIIDDKWRDRPRAWGDEGPDDHEITRLVITTERAVCEHAEFPAFERTWRHENEAYFRRGRTGHPDEIEAKLEAELKRAWCDRLAARNDELRGEHRAVKRAASRLRTLLPRHAAVVFSGSLDLDAAAIAGVEAWHRNPASCIAVLSGTPGVGKTTAAAWWCWQRARETRGDLPTWTTAQAFGRTSRYGDERVALLDAEALVVDELGAEYLDSKGSLSCDVDELVNAFYSSGRRLLLTTNADEREFETRYGARVVDRIIEAGTWIQCLGASRRRTR